MTKNTLTDLDRAQIAEAIATVEKNTRAEIVCMVAAQSSDYRLVPWVWAGLSVILVPVILLHLPPQWGWELTPLLMHGIQAAIFLAVGGILSFFPVKVTPGFIKRHRAHQEAWRQFCGRGFTGTRDRTGVLLYVSLAEHHADVIADHGIHQHVSTEVWAQVMATMVQHFRVHQIGSGLISAIKDIGQVLAKHVPVGKDDTNELSNRLIEL